MRETIIFKVCTIHRLFEGLSAHDLYHRFTSHSVHPSMLPSFFSFDAFSIDLWQLGHSTFDPKTKP